jgi:formylglycine-generating enzyme required for sulfatase activity
MDPDTIVAVRVTTTDGTHTWDVAIEDDDRSFLLPVDGLIDGERYTVAFAVVRDDGLVVEIADPWTFSLALGLPPLRPVPVTTTIGRQPALFWEHEPPASDSGALESTVEANAPSGVVFEYTVTGGEGITEMRTGAESPLEPSQPMVAEADIIDGAERAWRLRARSARGVLGPWSENGRVIFTTDIAISATAAHRGSPSVVARPALRWREVSGARGYEVELNPADAGDAAARFTADEAGIIIDGVTLAALLESGIDNISWRVRARGPGRIVTTWSDTFRFRYGVLMPSFAPVLSRETGAVVVMGAVSAPDSDERPAVAVSIPRAFAMARYELTTEAVAELFTAALADGRAVLDADGAVRTQVNGPVLLGTAALDFGQQFGIERGEADGQPLLVARSGYRAHPAVGVSWYGAVFLANELSFREMREPVYQWDELDGSLTVNRDADGYRLPTEAEWAFAGARTEETAPTGQPVRVAEDRTLGTVELRGTNFERSGDRWEDPLPPHTRNGGPTVPVGALGYARPVGVYDLVGNVWEWVEDWYDPEWYQLLATETSPDESPMEPPRDGGPEQAVPDIYGRDLRVVRGGAWNTPRAALRPYTRGGFAPDATSHSIGVRLVRTLAP